MSKRLKKFKIKPVLVYSTDKRMNQNEFVQQDKEPIVRRQLKKVV